MDNWNNPVAIATLILAFVTVLLAIAAFWSIFQNYIFRKEDREIRNKLKILSEISEFAHKARDTILSSLSEFDKYINEVSGNLIEETANLKAQIKIRKSKRGTTANNEEIRQLEKELEILEGKRLTEKDYKQRVMITLKDLMGEFDYCYKISHRFGKGLQPSIMNVDQNFVKITKILNSDSERYPDANLILGCCSALNQLALDANSIKSLLTRYGSKLEL